MEYVCISAASVKCSYMYSIGVLPTEVNMPPRDDTEMAAFPSEVCPPLPPKTYETTIDL